MANGADDTSTLNAMRRLNQAHELWHQAVDTYPDPDSFVVAVNALIPALRSVTFLLQKELRHEPGFDDWYEPWQQKLRDDPVMRWVVEARNRIEKEGDLELNSTARATVITSWLPGPVLDQEVPPLIPPSLIAVGIAASNVPQKVKDEGLVRVARRWVTASLPDHEILDACLHAFMVLSEMLKEAERRFRGVTAQDELFLVPPCMVLDPDARTATYHLASGSFVVAQSVGRASSKEDVQAAETKYGSEIEKLPKPADSLEGRVTWYHAIARILLRTDGYAASVAHLIRNGRPLTTISLQPADQQEKYLLMEHLAQQVVATGADEVIVTSETWTATYAPPTDERFELRAGQREDRGEGLDTMGANKAGELVGAFSAFTRVAERIVLGDVTTGTPPVALVMSPILRVWGLDPLRGGRVVDRHGKNP